MTHEDWGWLMIIGFYYLVKVVLPIVAIAVVLIGAYWFGRNRISITTEKRK